MDDFFQKYKTYLNELNQELRLLYHPSRCLKYKKGINLFRIAYSTLASGGKLLRSLLALLSCEAICGDYKPALPIAIAYELSHNASLVQDDIIDNSNFRRGRPTIHSEYRISTAILVADLFLFQIFNSIAKYKNYNLSKERLCQILEMGGNCSREVAIGEYLDEKFSGKINLPEKDYFLLISLKTGKLFAGPTACGAIVGNGTEKEINTLYKIGEKIGIAFQIFDDLLDITSQEKILKKPVFSDIKNGRQNLVILHAFKNSSLKSRKFLKEIFGEKHLTPKEEKKLKEILNETKSIEYAQEKCEKLITQVEKDLRKVKNDYYSAKEKILDVAKFVIARNL